MKLKNITMGNRIFLYILLVFCIVGCNTSSKLTPPSIYEYSFLPDSVYSWRVDSVFCPSDISYYTFPATEKIMSLSDIKKTFYNRYGKLTNKKLLHSDYIITLAISSSSTLVVYMRGEIPFYSSISIYGVTDWMETLYDEQGNIRRVNNGALKHPLLFTKGTGYYMDAQCIISEDSLKMQDVKNQKSLIDSTYWDDKGLLHSISYRIIERDSLIIKRQLNAYIRAEGNLEDNYKVGEWKYYDEKGNLVDIHCYKRNYKRDIRFPNCIWNKENPCYCNKKVI